MDPFDEICAELFNQSSDDLAAMYQLYDSVSEPSAPGPIRRSRKKKTCFSAAQLLALEQAFDENNKPSRASRCAIACNHDLPEDTVKTWFQNRRSRQTRALKVSKTRANAINNSPSSPFASPASFSNQSSCQVEPQNDLQELSAMPAIGQYQVQPDCTLGFYDGYTYQIQQGYTAPEQQYWPQQYWQQQYWQQQYWQQQFWPQQYHWQPEIHPETGQTFLGNARQQ
ncbi:retinal homeobox protein Rx1-like [Phlebotomus argentipes]|uniref:retinal homeobox protein Rx1-like n=1 Tax=Phlebotomus argentipes TaxID=94469 RepID=UPI002892E1B9|nr:retinal homeobox protein Rx1-like [Phlebotomus argentipes]